MSERTRRIGSFIGGALVCVSTLDGAITGDFGRATYGLVLGAITWYMHRAVHPAPTDRGGGSMSAKRKDKSEPVDLDQLRADVVDWFCGDGPPNYSTRKAEAALERYVRARIAEVQRA